MQVALGRNLDHDATVRTTTWKLIMHKSRPECGVIGQQGIHRAVGVSAGLNSPCSPCALICVARSAKLY